MDNKLTFTGGEPNMREDDFLRIQRANLEFIQSFLRDFGECIIEGETLVAPGSGVDLTLTTDAFIYLDGEVLKVDADTYTAGVGFSFWRYEKVTTYETGGDKTFLDGTPRQTWEKNRGVPVSVAAIGVGDLDVIDGKRLFIPVKDWTAVPFATNWADQPGSTPTEYKKDQNGVVYLRGAFKKSVAGSGLTTVFTLPLGFRPTQIEYPWIESSAVLQAGQMKADGTFQISSADFTVPHFFSLSFRTD